MASAGIRRNRNGTRYQVWWRLDDGTQGSKTFDTRALARDFKNELLAQAAANAWVDPRRGHILFDDWADHWWRLWSSNPRRSPKGMETTESHLRCHLRPYFGRRQLRQITPRPCRVGSTSSSSDSAIAGLWPVAPSCCASWRQPARNTSRHQPGPRGRGPQAALGPRTSLRPPAPTHSHPRGGRPPPGRRSALLPRPLPHLGRHRAAQRRAAADR